MPASVQGPVGADVTRFSRVDLRRSLILQQWQWHMLALSSLLRLADRTEVSAGFLRWRLSQIIHLAHTSCKIWVANSSQYSLILKSKAGKGLKLESTLRDDCFHYKYIQKTEFCVFRKRYPFISCRRFSSNRPLNNFIWLNSNIMKK